MKLLVIDDHFLVRDALRGVVGRLSAYAEIVEASDWREAGAFLGPDADFDLVVLDIGLPDRDGFEVLAELRERHPSVPVVVLSARNDRASVERALEFGASGFIPKSARREVLSGAINLILAGGTYIPPELLVGAGHRGPRSGRGVPDLTTRQRDVLALMMKGLSNKGICRELDLAEPTVKNHVTAILKVLGAANRTEAVIAAQAGGFRGEDASRQD